MSKVSTLLSQARSALLKASEFFTEEGEYWPEAKHTQKALPTRGQIEAEKTIANTRVVKPNSSDWEAFPERPKLTGSTTGRLYLDEPNLEDTVRVPLKGGYGTVKLSGDVGWTPTFPSVLKESRPTLTSEYEYQVHINPDEREPVFETMMRDFPERTMFVLDLLERRNAGRRVSNARS